MAMSGYGKSKEECARAGHCKCVKERNASVCCICGEGFPEREKENNLKYDFLKLFHYAVTRDDEGGLIPYSTSRLKSQGVPEELIQQIINRAAKDFMTVKEYIEKSKPR